MFKIAKIGTLVIVFAWAIYLSLLSSGIQKWIDYDQAKKEIKYEREKETVVFKKFFASEKKGMFCLVFLNIDTEEEFLKLYTKDCNFEDKLNDTLFLIRTDCYRGDVLMYSETDLEINLCY